MRRMAPVMKLVSNVAIPASAENNFCNPLKTPRCSSDSAPDSLPRETQVLVNSSFRSQEFSGAWEDTVGCQGSAITASEVHRISNRASSISSEEDHGVRHVRCLRHQYERLFADNWRDMLRLFFRVTRLSVQDDILRSDAQVLGESGHGFGRQGRSAGCRAPGNDEFTAVQRLADPNPFDKAHDRIVVELQLNRAARVVGKTTPEDNSILCLARTNPARSRELVGAFPSLDRKNLQKIPICDVLHKYRTEMRRGRWRGARRANGSEERKRRHTKGGPSGRATGCTSEGCDLGREAEVLRQLAAGQFARATGCTTQRNLALPTASDPSLPRNKF